MGREDDSVMIGSIDMLSQSSSVYTYIHTYIHTYIPTYIPTYIYTYIHTFIQYIHTYIHTFHFDLSIAWSEFQRIGHQGLEHLRDLREVSCEEGRYVSDDIAG